MNIDSLTKLADSAKELILSRHLALYENINSKSEYFNHYMIRMKHYYILHPITGNAIDILTNVDLADYKIVQKIDSNKLKPSAITINLKFNYPFIEGLNHD